MDNTALQVLLLIIVLYIIGVGGVLAVKRYLKDMRAIEEKHKDKKPKEKTPVPEKEMGPIGTALSVIAAYWFIFAGIIHWLSGDSELSDSTFLAPVVLPLMWLWGIISSKTFWYIVGAMTAMWWLQQALIQPIHDKLDRILQKLDGR